MVRPGFHDDNVRARRDDLARAEQGKRDAERRGANSTELTSIADTIRKTRDSLTNAERARDQANNGK